MRYPCGRYPPRQATLVIVSNHLPPAAEARMAEIRRSGTWGSALTSDEFAAVRSVGFQPVGQVLGAAVYNIGYTGGYGCPGAWGGYNFGWGPAGTTQVSSKGGYGSFGPLVKTMYDARRAAISRMVAECAALGGHGVVGVRLTIGQFPAGGLEFKAIGTAVRAPRRPRAAPPVHLRPVRPGLRQAGAQRLDAGRARARHHGRGPARRLADGRADPLVGGQRRGQRLDRAGQRRPARRPAAARRRRQAHRRRGRGHRRAWTCGSASASARPRRAAATTSSRRSTSAPRSSGSKAATWTQSQRPPLAIMSLDPQRRQAARVDIGQNRR